MTTQTVSHTPGPWTVGTDPENEEDFSVWTDVEGAVNAEIAGRICEEANARLMAAAPDLLVALEGLFNIATHPKATKEQIRTIAQEARATITKAKGTA